MLAVHECTCGPQWGTGDVKWELRLQSEIQAWDSLAQRSVAGVGEDMNAMGGYKEKMAKDTPLRGRWSTGR